MKYLEEYKGRYDEASREEIRDTIKRGRVRESRTQFVNEERNVTIIVDEDGLTFDVMDTTNPVYVLVGNKLMIENDDLLIDLLIDYSEDRLVSFKQHREKVANFVIDNLTVEQKDKLLVAFLLSDIEKNKMNILTE